MLETSPDEKTEVSFTIEGGGQCFRFTLDHKALHAVMNTLGTGIQVLGRSPVSESEPFLSAIQMSGLFFAAMSEAGRCVGANGPTFSEQKDRCERHGLGVIFQGLGAVPDAFLKAWED